MRRREKFVISSIVLSLGLLVVQLIDLDYRYYAVAVFGVLSYLVSAWSLADDLQSFEWLTILPSPALYATAVSLFYFLLPTSIVSRFIILGLFGVGMYASFLTGNIYSVAKGRTIQLIHAAHAIGLLLTLFTSLLFTNSIFSLRLPFYINGLLVGLVHFPLLLTSLWSVHLEPRVSKEIITLTLLLTLLVAEIGVILSLYPLSIWNVALLIMSLVYIGLGIMHNYLRGVLFQNTLTEYSLVAAFVGIVFLFLFPLK